MRLLVNSMSPRPRWTLNAVPFPYDPAGDRTQDLRIKRSSRHAHASGRQREAGARSAASYTPINPEAGRSAGRLLSICRHWFRSLFTALAASGDGWEWQ